MSEVLSIKLTDSEDVVLKQSEKTHCFFVGSVGQATNAVFERAYEITHKNWPENLFASFEVGAREFTNLSFSMGKTLSKAKGSYKLKKHPDGTVYLCMDLEYPVHDSYERLYACRFRRVIYRENEQVVVIQAKYGSVLPKINVFIGLKQSVPYLDTLLNILDNSDACQQTRLKLLMRCVAQKYHLSDACAEQMENFVVYTCLDAANISASFGIFKNKKKSLSYELLKAIADYICGNCLPDWYNTAPRRRNEKLSDLIDYIRRLKRDKYVEWSEEEKAYCHSIRKWIDSSVFADVYAVSLVLLRFLAENDISDVNSFKTAAVAPGIFNTTLMADTVDRFTAGQLDGEAKQVFFSLVGKNAENVKTRMERALYRYHAESNYLFRTAQGLTLLTGIPENKRQAKVLDDAVEAAVLCAAAKAALLTRSAAQQAPQAADDEIKQIIASMSQVVAQTYGVCLMLNGEAIGAEDLWQFATHCLERVQRRGSAHTGNTYFESIWEFAPENNFVLVYTIAFVLLRMVQQALGNEWSFTTLMEQTPEDVFADKKWITREDINTIMLEAKYRYGAMCGAQLLEEMARSAF